MKRFLAPMLIGATLATAASAADDSLKAEIAALKVQMAELKEAQSKMNYDALKRQIGEVKAHTGGDNIKWSVDFRTAYDVLDYKMSKGSSMSGVYNNAQPMMGMFTPPGTPKDKDNAVWTNKLILGMAAQPVDNLVFKGALGFYKTFGQSNMGSNSMFQNFDWYDNQKPQSDNLIRLREAYFLYLGKMGDMPYTVSFGRRPSTDGFMTNLREDNDHPASPVGHNINMEFDGASFKFDFEKLTGISGFYAKICLGRGFSETRGSYSMGSYGFNEAYSKDGGNPNMDLAGLLVQAYDDGQYKVMVNVFQGWNMMGMGLDINYVGPNPMTGPATGTYTMAPNGFYDVGDMSGASLSLQVNGIGDEINDFLDDTVFFASYAMNKTKPNNKVVNTMNVTPAGSTTSTDITSTVLGAMPAFGGAGMLGSQDNETGYSYYVGINMPGFMEADRVGLEYNHGSKYWRSFTYGEDTLAGSKLATRGDAYEIYYNLPLIGKNLTAQLRYTMMDYKYGGSDTFFGQTGSPTGLMGAMPFVDKAQNIRLSMRYRY